MQHRSRTGLRLLAVLLFVCAGCGVQPGALVGTLAPDHPPAPIVPPGPVRPPRPVPPTPKKVVFIGASITQYLASYVDFAANDWIDKGISGQTSMQVAARFQTDALALNPDAVHILCGTNDLNSSWVPQKTWNAFTSMIAEAKAAGVPVYIGTIPPWGDGPQARISDPDFAGRNARVATLNAWLQAQPGVTVIDYHTLLKDNDGFYNPALTTDGIHPNAAGYAVMTPAVLKALE